MGRRTVSLYPEGTVEVKVEEVIEALDDDDLKAYGLKRTGGFEDAISAVFRAVKDTHDQKHELPFVSCNEEVCGELKHDEVSAIQEASYGNWGRRA